MVWRITQTSASSDESLAIAGRARLRDRVVAKLGFRRLDQALAEGVNAEATAALAVRARGLTALPRRREIAGSYRRLLHDARAGVPRSAARVAVCRSRVAAAGEDLHRLADALAEPGPIAPQGVAQALLLLRDGTGPLYNPGSSENLRACAARASANLVVQ